MLEISVCNLQKEDDLSWYPHPPVLCFIGYPGWFSFYCCFKLATLSIPSALHLALSFPSIIIPLLICNQCLLSARCGTSCMTCMRNLRHHVGCSNILVSVRRRKNEEELRLEKCISPCCKSSDVSYTVSNLDGHSTTIDIKVWGLARHRRKQRSDSRIGIFQIFKTSIL